MGKDPTYDLFTSPSPSVIVSITLNPTQVTRLIYANTNREQKTTYNIKISSYLTQVKPTRFEIHTSFKNTLHKK